MLFIIIVITVRQGSTIIIIIIIDVIILTSELCLSLIDLLDDNDENVPAWSDRDYTYEEVLTMIVQPQDVT